MKLDGSIIEGYQQIDIHKLCMFMYLFEEVNKNIKYHRLERFIGKIKRK